MIRNYNPEHKKYVNRRRYHRYETNDPIFCYFSDASGFCGTILNQSKGGAFIKLESGYVDGEFLYEMDLLNEIKPGDFINVEIDNDKALVEVRWKGSSNGHIGFGCQLLKNCEFFERQILKQYA